MIGAFRKVEKNIQRAFYAKKNILINTVLFNENFDQYMELFNYFNEKYSNIMYSPTFAIPSNTGNEFENSIQINKENIEKYKMILDKIGKEKIVYKHGLYGLCGEEFNKPDFAMPVCAAGKSKMIIKYNGNVYPCNFFQSNEYLCWNVFKDNVKEIWKNGQGFNIFRKYYLENELPSKCMACKKKNNCYSGCKAWTKSYRNGNLKINKERDERCEFMHAFIGIRDYNKV